MRRWVLWFVAGSLALGDEPSRPTEPLPPLNAKVVAFASEHLGKPVGNGVCTTLAIDALNEARAKRYPFDRSGDYVWGEPVSDFKDVLPGDILQFRDAVFRGQRTTAQGRKVNWHAEYPHHTAVVARVERGGRLIAIYHQNVATKGQPSSERGNVQEGELRMESLQKGGWIKAYRPVAPDRPVANEG